MAVREGLAGLCPGAVHSRSARLISTSGSLRVYIWICAKEREGLIRFAQGVAPKPAGFVHIPPLAFVSRLP